MPEHRPPATPPGPSGPTGLVVTSSGLLMVAPMLSAPGTIRLDDSGLSFERSPGLSGRLAPASGTEIAAEAISSARLAQGELTVKGPGRSLRLGGGAVGEIAAVLRAMGVPERGEAPAARSACHGAVTATFASGPLQRHGHLAVGPSGVAFAPSGAIDLATGSWPRHVGADEIRRVAVTERVLTVETATEELAFINLDTDAALALFLAMLQPPDQPPAARPWRCGALLIEGLRLTPGDLGVIDDTVLWFTDRAGAERDLGPLQSVFSGERTDGVPLLDGGRAGWRARLSRQPDPIAALEEEIGRLPPLPPEESERAKASSLARDIIAVRFRQGDGATRTLRPAVVEQGEGTIDLLLPEGPFVASLPDMRLVLTLMGRRRLLRFGTRPWRLEPVDRDALNPRQARALADAERLVRLRLPWPAKTDLSEERNHRGMVRIHMDSTPVQAEIGPTRSRVRLEDLSGGGAGLASRVPLVLDSRVALYVGLPGIEDPLEAQVAWARRTDHGYIGGVRFQDEREAFQELMVHYVYRLELLVARGERRPIQVLAEQIAARKDPKG